MRRFFLPLLMQGLIGTAPGLAQVPDPTRPAGHEGGSAVPTVIMRPGGKSVAVIYGEYVGIGGKVGDRRVVNISEREVTLEGDRGIEVIKVIPAVEKLPQSKRSVGAKIAVPEIHSQSGEGATEQ